MKRYYQGHEYIYRQLRAKRISSWDEYFAVSSSFEEFYLHDFIEEILQFISFSSSNIESLEVGCGTGPLCCYLAQKGHHVTGIDISESAIFIARREAQKRRLTISYRVADICLDPLLEENFDLIIDGHCLHCIVGQEERHQALSNIRRALKPHGFFVLETMIAKDSIDFEGSYLDSDGILWQPSPHPAGSFDLERQIHGKTHLATRRILTEKQIEAELHQAGFRIYWSREIPSASFKEPNDLRVVARPN